ncbi:MAG: DNA-directed RNA polymerase subunit K [Candidatus Woesearchaeota archaeon]|nr:DNA-directed RNA polymerase subunit K [Candidatus Woesearchaeota archaeon]
MKASKAEDYTKKFTKYEIARMLGSRSMQIAMGAPFLVKLSKEDLERIKYNPLEIAKLEFEQGIIPITIRRPYPQPRYKEESEEKKAEKKE